VAAAALTLAGCPNNANPKTNNKDKKTLVAVEALVEANADDTSATAKFTGAERLTLATADFAVSTGA
jgi:uncharacterized lipoprotein NlpE involved in copper resistance